MKITVVGLGYVGLPLACLCAEKGHDVSGLDIDSARVEKISKGISPIEDESLAKKLKKVKIRATAKPEECIPKSEIIIVCVPTPVDHSHSPDLKPLIDSVTTVSKHIKKGSMLVIESTINPGVVEEVVAPILKAAGIDPAKNDIHLSHCPERIDPGNKKWTVENIPRVVGAVTNEALKKAAEFYRGIISAEITELSTVKAAEATKIMENTFRDINIAFINEMARSFDMLGIDIMEVIKGASTKPFAFMPHYPGIGVGGHCIPVDPYYLIKRAKQTGFDHRFLSLAREINESMPHYTAELVEKAILSKAGIMQGAKIGVMGLAYKANVDDIRESPALKLLSILRGKGADVRAFDPHVADMSDFVDLNELLDFSDYLIIATDHAEFKKIPAEDFKKNNIKAIIDGKNCLDMGAIKGLKILYHGIGRS